MRRMLIAAFIAASAALTGVAPVEAGAYRAAPTETQYANGVQQVEHYYGHRRHKKYYKRRHYEPVCFWKKIRRYDSYGNLIVKRIKVCE
ncbi:hypothetical protein [Pararhizobium sp.]|uniref:hypothetical protein n=1 Tax=Pararhizobium sp. TaxID=1977563 RepID=UPI0027205E6D|nr:hypothetical protein [Pararhizobium sp.]MDO9417695.1 hypothetical protein [Pararhizobium sp.]